MTSRTRSAWPELSDMTGAWLDLTDAYGAFLGAVGPSMAPDRGARHRPEHCDCRDACDCRDCRDECASPCREGCHCDCCVGDVDLLVRARLGERRVVPLRIHNDRRRSRQITLELSSFSTSGGRAVPVEGRIVTPTSFELEGCSEHEVVLVLELGDADSLAKAVRTGEGQHDVDDCLVAYADLRVQGCDVRPVRVAVQLLPRDCEAHEVRCACGCC